EVSLIAEAHSLEKVKKLSEQIQHNYILALNAKLLSWGQKLKVKKFFLPLGVPESIFVKIRNFLVFCDYSTLLHPDHISSTQGASGVWRTSLSSEELEIIMERYQDWMIEAGYINTTLSTYDSKR
ncbi:hypothetical protein THIOM_002852, partial [Candidatus Thiomargarita nelsonii]